MKMVSELTNDEYIDLVLEMPLDEVGARTYCQSKGIDFEDVKAHDWGLEWQY